MPYTQYGLALGFGSAWVACTGAARPANHVPAKSPRASRTIEPWTLAAGAGAVWALGRDERPSTGSIPRRTGSGPRRARRYRRRTSGRSRAACGLRTTPTGTLIRLDPVACTCRRGFPVGDGPAGSRLRRHVPLGAEPPREHARPDRPGDRRRHAGCPARSPPETRPRERVAELGGSLWVTGRGPTCSAARRRGRRSERRDRACRDGGRHRRLEPLDVAFTPAAAAPRGPGDGRAAARGRGDGQVVARVAATRRLFVNGLAAADGALWVDDGVAGLLVGCRPEGPSVK